MNTYEVIDTIRVTSWSRTFFYGNGKLIWWLRLVCTIELNVNQKDLRRVIPLLEHTLFVDVDIDEDIWWTWSIDLLGDNLNSDTSLG